MAPFILSICLAGVPGKFAHEFNPIKDHMNLASRILAALALLPFLAFCVFGFIATFEPLDPSIQLFWRVIYGLAALACVGGIVGLLRPRAKCR
jgi:hypothetical protein